MFTEDYVIKTILALTFVIGGILVYILLDGYWLFAWIGLWIAFGFTCVKLTIDDALRLWGIVLGIVAVMLGGGTILARLFGEWAGGIWVFSCIVLLMLLRKKIVGLIPILHLTKTFDDIVKEKSKK